MGIQGDKLSGAATKASESLVRKLSHLGDVSARKMFGGYGVFESGTMFALVSSEGQTFFKVGDENRSRFERLSASRHGKMPYFEVPEHILSDQIKLEEWAQESFVVARKSKKR